MELSLVQQRALLDAARDRIRAALADGKLADPPGDLDPALLQPGSCFVTLHERESHQLRGCIGRLQSDRPLYHTVQEMAAAVLADPRFTLNPVTVEELPELELEISVLSPLEPAAHPMDFDLQNDGIYLVFGSRSGCFLPQVARETGWTRDELLDRLCSEKMGLHPATWRNAHAKLYRFRAVVIGPVPFVDAMGDER